jgi:hypothetical protein
VSLVLDELDMVMFRNPPISESKNTIYGVKLLAKTL